MSSTSASPRAGSRMSATDTVVGAFVVVTDAPRRDHDHDRDRPSTVQRSPAPSVTRRTVAEGLAKARQLRARRHLRGVAHRRFSDRCERRHPGDVLRVRRRLRHPPFAAPLWREPSPSMRLHRRRRAGGGHRAHPPRTARLITTAVQALAGRLLPSAKPFRSSSSATIPPCSVPGQQAVAQRARHHHPCHPRGALPDPRLSPSSRGQYGTLLLIILAASSWSADRNRFLHARQLAPTVSARTRRTASRGGCRLSPSSPGRCPRAAPQIGMTAMGAYILVAGAAGCSSRPSELGPRSLRSTRL